jgi:hypothetical protein
VRNRTPPITAPMTPVARALAQGVQHGPGRLQRRVDDHSSPIMPSDQAIHKGTRSQRGAVQHAGDVALGCTGFGICGSGIKKDARGTRIVKEHKKSPRRIELAMAAILAFDRAEELVGKRVSFW